MFKSLLNDYEASQRSLMLENAELKKVLQQMKKEMIHILSPRQLSTRGAIADDSQEQVFVSVFSWCAIKETRVRVRLGCPWGLKKSYILFLGY